MGVELGVIQGGRPSMQAPTAALERYLSGKGGSRSGGSESTLAASIDAHLAALCSTRDSCSAELGSMQAILDRLVEVRALY